MPTTNASDTTINTTINSNNKTQDTAPVDSAVSTDPRSLAAYSGLLAEARAIPRDDLLQLNLDVPVAATTCIAVARRMAQHRPWFASLPTYDMSSFDGLEAVGLALLVAQADYCAAVRPPDSLPDLLERGTALRTEMQDWGEALTHGDLISRDTATALRGGAGHRELAVRLMGWVRAYRATDWEKVKRVTMLTDAKLTAAQSIAEQLFAIVGDRDLQPERAATAADIRHRVFTLAVRRYDQVRRGAIFMRWNEDDVDDLVPSLFAKGPRKSEKDDKDAANGGKGAPVTPPAPAPAPGPAARPAGGGPVAPHDDDDGPNSRPFINR